MSTGTVIAIVVVVIVVLAVVAAGAMMARRRRLQQQFGPEYDRVAQDRSSHLKADAELAGRARRVRKLDIKPLSPELRDSYAARWTGVQEQFVDRPDAAVAAAEQLVVAVMADRGYPTEDDDDQVAADLSVEHASTLEHYRAARTITADAASGQASTEDLRRAMIHYRALFEELLGLPASTDASAAATTDPAAEAGTDPAVAPNGTTTTTGTTGTVPDASASPPVGHEASDVPVTMGSSVPVDGDGVPAEDPADAADPAAEVPVQRSRR
jgi:hypothetical protein